MAKLKLLLLEKVVRATPVSLSPYRLASGPDPYDAVGGRTKDVIRRHLRSQDFLAQVPALVAPAGEWPPLDADLTSTDLTPTSAK
jgi:hypothetical protein